MYPYSIVSNTLKNYVNDKLSNQEPWQIVIKTAATVLSAAWCWQFFHQNENIWKRGTKCIYRFARKIPFIAKKIEEELIKVEKQFEISALQRTEGLNYVKSLKEKGMSHDEIIQEVKKHLDMGNFKWKNGYVSGVVYSYNEELLELMTEVYGLASYTNPLHVEIFPGVCKMEAEVIQIAVSLFKGGPDACGTMTSGGTESILMACKAYRDYGYFEKGIKQPEMVIPRTAHPAFEKAGSYFGIAVKYVQVDSKSTSVLTDSMKRSITRNTIMIVGSFPNFPYGTADDITKIAKIGRKYNIPVHVDCCLGGFLTVFMPAAKFSVPPYDFSLAGVTSISADTHKYGYAPKGSSVILYSHQKYRHYQYSVTTEWPGGVYGSPSISGSRAGGIIVSCWATLMHHGLEGYVEATKEIIKTRIFIEKRLRELKEIFIFGTPLTSVIAIGSDIFHIYRLCDKMNAKGWNLNALQFPPGIHICITKMHTAKGVADQFISDVKSSLEEVLKEPNEQMDGMLAMYGMAQKIPDRSIVADFTSLYLDYMYYTPNHSIKQFENSQNGF